MKINPDTVCIYIFSVYSYAHKLFAKIPEKCSLTNSLCLVVSLI